MTNVLVIGSGGREHALTWALARSARVSDVYVAPGNGGTVSTDSSRYRNVEIEADDFDMLIDFAKEFSIGLTVVGPEVPLVNGIVDAFQAAGLTIFGPVQAAAQLEGSKAFAKDFMTEQNIPTGEYFTTNDYDEARHFLAEYKRPVVVKASGLAAGKGVLICDTREEAETALYQVMVDKVFGDAGSTVVIEERLKGRELSVLAFCDGKTAKPMIVARDYKRALDGNKGLNTGGMGAIAPADDVSQELIDNITKTAILPVIEGMKNLGTPYIGVLYAGIMLTDDGAKVLEYNCRFGDPETQVILPLLKTDLLTIMQACVNGTLADLNIEWRKEYCATVVCAAPGYPEAYPKGLPISGVDSVSRGIVFHAGTAIKDGQLVTNGGRVLAVTALGDTLKQALEKSYAGVKNIHFDNMHFRTDIGKVYE